ncbi:NDP-sugar synthase [Candidatus Peribacteria bacterium]|nr:NDP-sugar synthase [Candidatus Peribacteria bacterium]
MKAFILAGGFATRLWPLSERRAKPLLPLAGKPLLTYVVESIPKDIPVTVSTNAVFADDMKAWAKTINDRDITISIEDAGHEGEKLGALGAVSKWLTEENIDDDLLLLAGDNYVGCSMEKFFEARGTNPLIAAHDIGDRELAKQFGTVIVENLSSSLGGGAGGGGGGKVTSFEEKPLHPKSTFVSTGWWWLPKGSLSVLKEHASKHPDNVGGVFEEFLKRGMTVDAFVFKETWHDIGSFESYLHLHREIVDGKTLADNTSSMSPNCILEGSISIGPNVKIEKSTLRDCILFGNSTITDCVLERCIIDEDCRLEGVDLTDQMLRAGTILKRP